MKLTMHQVDAFADAVFAGNPAAVIVTPDELPAPLMQSIAAENNLSETAFVRGERDALAIRWFTPTVEVDLCGHATLAAAHVLLSAHWPDAESVQFSSRSGALKVYRQGDLLWLDFPADPVAPENEGVDAVNEALGLNADALFRGRHDLMAVAESEDAVRALEPDIARIARLDCRGMIVTARGRDIDFVSRFFAPQSGIPEDPVTGSAHTTLTPYWSEVLGKDELTARQVSARGGELRCRNRGERIHIGGRAVTYFEGEIRV
jgi:PhzF family phenazine biosynthesis protein